MKTIWRFDFPVDDRVGVLMPEGARILPHVSTGRSGRGLSVWAEVDTDSRKSLRVLLVVGTGNPFDPAGHEYVGSVADGPFVWHVYAEAVK